MTAGEDAQPDHCAQQSDGGGEQTLPGEGNGGWGGGLFADGVHYGLREARGWSELFVRGIHVGAQYAVEFVVLRVLLSRVHRDSLVLRLGRRLMRGWSLAGNMSRARKRRA